MTNGTRAKRRFCCSQLLYQVQPALAHGQQSVEALIGTVGNMVESMDTTAAAAHSNDIFTFLLGLLDLRRQRLSAIPRQDELDHAVLSTLLDLVMKLSEAKFKPLFLRLLEWVSAAPDGSPLARPLVLFSTAEVLGARLRSVFVPYFTYLLDSAVGHLGQLPDGAESSKPSKKRRKAKAADDDAGAGTAEDDLESALLRFKVIRALSVCFEHDNAGFLEPERFNRLLPVIASQLDSQMTPEALAAVDRAAKACGRLPGPEGASSTFIGTHGWSLVDCLSSMAIASGSDEHWRPLNHAVLMSTRSESSMTKLIALEVGFAVLHHECVCWLDGSGLPVSNFGKGGGGGHCLGVYRNPSRCPRI